MRTPRGDPATITAQWCSQGPSGSTKADADAKSVTKEAVYMLAFRCLVLLRRSIFSLLVRVRRSTGLMRCENVFFSHRYELCAVFWLGEVL